MGMVSCEEIKEGGFVLPEYLFSAVVDRLPYPRYLQLPGTSVYARTLRTKYCGFLPMVFEDVK